MLLNLNQNNTKNWEIMNAKEFKELTGCAPVDDDLERVNCKNAGEPGHSSCGLCPLCKKPASQGCHNIYDSGKCIYR